MLLGDAIAKLTSAIGIKPCTPCKARQDALNKWHAQMTGQQIPGANTYLLEVHDGQPIAKVVKR